MGQIKGKGFSDLGFFSSSRSYEVAKEYSGRDIIFEIRANKARVLDMNGNGVSVIPSEQEMLFDKNSHFIVKDVQRRADNSDDVLYKILIECTD